MTISRFLSFSVGLVVLVAGSTQAAVPGLISYQGRLTSSSGVPVADGAYLIKFQIYDASAGGNVLWNSNYQSVQAKDGLYTYVLGQDIPLPNGLFTGGNRWLGVTIGVDPEMAPRQQMIATGYAFVSQNADSVNWSGIKNIPAGFADGIDDNSGGDITAVNTSGGLSGGAVSGDANISITNGGVTSTHIGDGQIVNADIDPTANIDPSKVDGTAATLGGTQTFTGLNTFKTFDDTNPFTFENTVQVGDSPFLLSGSLLTMNSLGTSSIYKGIDVRLRNDDFGVQGCFFQVVGTTGNANGIYAQVSSDGAERAGAQMYVQTLTPGLTTGNTYGVQSVAMDGAASYGVHGTAIRGAEVTGVYGSARMASQQGTGVVGIASDNLVIGLGTYGGATANTIGYGVYGEAWANSSVNWAGFFGGDVNVTGTVFMPAKVSRIDHPFDPENKYLQHADVQSPDMLNVYTGNVVTSGSGDAQVQLPDYFIAINSDFRYQLTVVGQFAQAIISSEIQDNRFSIKTDKPSVRVSWQVTGIRQDRYAQAHRVETEAAKLSHEVGKYLHPELFGFGHDRSLTAEIRESALKALANSQERAELSKAGVKLPATSQSKSSGNVDK